MDTRLRILTCLTIKKMENQKKTCEEIGIKDVSKYKKQQKRKDD